MTDIIIIGIGQELRGDDAVGPNIVRIWQDQHPENANLTRVEISPTPGLELLDLLEGADTAIIVDAAQSGAKPGTVHIVGMDQLDSFAAGSGSAHGFGVAETIAIGRQANPASIPETVIIIALETHRMELGQLINLEIRASIPSAVSKLETIVRQHIS